jgi:hypothetical protein
MKDVFYTLLVVWIIWRIMNSVNTMRAKQPPPAAGTSTNVRKEGQTHVDYVPPRKKTVADNEGEYVDYEEIK